MIFQTMSQLGDTLKGIIQISKGSIKILNSERVRGALVDRLFSTAILHEKAEMRGMARWIIKMTAQHFGIYFSPVEMLYEMVKSKSNTSMTLPVFSLDRKMGYESARAIFLAAIQVEAGIFLFQLGENVLEVKKAIDSPEKQQVMIAAAAIQAVFTGPIFCLSQTTGSLGVSAMNFPGFPKDRGEEPLSLLGNNEVKWKEIVIKTFNTCHVTQTRQKIKNRCQGKEKAVSLRDEIAVAADESSTTQRQDFIASLCAKNYPPTQS